MMCLKNLLTKCKSMIELKNRNLFENFYKQINIYYKCRFYP